MFSSLKSKPLIAITMGDPAGIGGEVTLKALSSIAPKSKSNFLLLGDYRHWLTLAQKFKFRFPLIWVNDAELGRELKRGVALLDLGGVKKIQWCKISATNGATTVGMYARGPRWP